jgi:hypothetical protein
MAVAVLPLHPKSDVDILLDDGDLINSVYPVNIYEMPADLDISMANKLGEDSPKRPFQIGVQ